MTTRRRFLLSAAAAAGLPALSWADAGDPAYLAAAREADGGYALFGLAPSGTDLFRIALPDRGHAAAAHPIAPEAVAFARRPGTFGLVLDCARGRIVHRLQLPEGRHFYGHGAFIAGGDVLCTTENDIGSGQGRIGFWSRHERYRRIGEVASGGIGPHDILALTGDVLAVANGGIRTHPDHGRDKLNLDTMQPSLVYLTPEGVIEERVELDRSLHHLSIRHLAASGGVVAFAMQWEGALPDPAPLLGLHRRGAAPILCSAELGEQISMDGYAGSIAIHGALAGITSPRGGRLHLFDLADGRFRASVRRADICGLAGGPAGLMATDGLGGVFALEGDRMRLCQKASREWDNHLVAI